jgi:carboxypeptidase Q
MIVRFPLCAVAAVVAVSLPLRAQSTESVDTAAVEFLRQEGLERSQVMDHLSWICDVFGGRLTGSPNIRRAQDWALGRLRELGLADVREDEWGPFGRSWRLVEFAMKVEGENPWPVLAWPKAWSPSLQGEISAQVIDADALSADELRAIDLTDKIVLTESARPIAEWFVGTGHRFTDSELLAMADGRSVPPRDTGQPGSADFRNESARSSRARTSCRRPRWLSSTTTGSSGSCRRVCPCG